MDTGVQKERDPILITSSHEPSGVVDVRRKVRGVNLASCVNQKSGTLLQRISGRLASDRDVFVTADLHARADRALDGPAIV